MSTVIRGWRELLDYVAEEHPAMEEFPDRRARFSHRHDPSARFLVWETTSPRGRPWLVLALKIGPGTILRGHGALAGNGCLPIGALALRRDDVLLRQTLPLAELPADRFEHTATAMLDTLATLKDIAQQPASAPTDVPYAFVFRPFTPPDPT